MRYDERATVVTAVFINGPLGLEASETSSILPCHEQNVSLDEAASLFGGSLNHTLKLHFQHTLDNVTKVYYKGKPYDVTATRGHRRATVLYLERSGHHAE